MSPLMRDGVRAGVPTAMVDAQGFARVACAAGRINSFSQDPLYLLVCYMRVYDMGLVAGAAPKKALGCGMVRDRLQSSSVTAGIGIVLFCPDNSQ